MTKERRSIRYKLMDIDPWLEPYEKDINLRMEKYFETKEILLGESQSLTTFANGHLYFGFHKSMEGWYYREWAPAAKQLFLIGDFNHWNPTSHPLVRKKNACAEQNHANSIGSSTLTKGENGIWEIFLPGVDALKHLSLVKVRVVTDSGVLDRIPLYIHRAVQDPVTNDFIGQIWNPENPYQWNDNDYRTNEREPIFIYEAHIGMAQEDERIGTYREFADKILPRIKASGYNTVQLMAVMNHPYYASFGYHVSNFFAASSWFGTPDDLKYLVDKAHHMGLAVLMDIVHSHAVKNISEGINAFDGTVTQFFHAGARGLHPAWDSMVFQYGKHEIIHFLLSNIKFWMEEYHFDGFRFDGITSMIYLDHGLGTSFDNYKKYYGMNTDIDAIVYLQLANELIRQLNPHAITIAEDMSGMPGMCLPLEYGGIGFDYRLNMGIPDYWIKLLKNTPDEIWNMSNIWHEMTMKRPQERCIGYCESHDQALVGDKTIFFRLGDKEIYDHMSKFSNSIIIERAIAIHKMIRFITLTLAGDGYLNFMGNEFGHPEWIDFPREGNNWSFKHCRRQWSLVDTDHLKYSYLYEFDVQMLKFAKEHNLLDFSAISLWNDDEKKLIAFKKSNLIFLFNFNPVESFTEYELPTNELGSYKVVFSSDEDRFGGYDRISFDYIYKATDLKQKKGCTGIVIYSPSRTVLVLQKLS